MVLEADRLGAEYLTKVGYAPESMIDVVRLLKNQEMYEIARAREQPRVAGHAAQHPRSNGHACECRPLP